MSIAVSDVIPSNLCQKTQPKRDGQICYWLVSESGTWSDAHARCQQDGGNLALISDLLDNTFIVELLNENQVTQAWIGLTESITSWEWLSGKCSFVFIISCGSRISRLGGANSLWGGGRRLPTLVLFGGNICENGRIGSYRAAPPGPATDNEQL